MGAVMNWIIYAMCILTMIVLIPMWLGCLAILAACTLEKVVSVWETLRDEM